MNDPEAKLDVTASNWPANSLHPLPLTAARPFGFSVVNNKSASHEVRHHTSHTVTAPTFRARKFPQHPALSTCAISSFISISFLHRGHALTSAHPILTAHTALQSFGSSQGSMFSHHSLKARHVPQLHHVFHTIFFTVSPCFEHSATQLTV